MFGRISFFREHQPKFGRLFFFLEKNCLRIGREKLSSLHDSPSVEELEQPTHILKALRGARIMIGERIAGIARTRGMNGTPKPKKNNYLICNNDLGCRRGECDDDVVHPTSSRCDGNLLNVNWESSMMHLRAPGNDDLL